MVSPETLAELVAVSDELASLLGRPLAAQKPAPANSYLHPDLVSLGTCGAIHLDQQGVDVSQVDEFTERAQSRGMRLNVLIFGWHPQAHTWLATPTHYGADAQVIEIDRMNRLATTEYSLPEFVQLCIDRTRASIDKITAEPAPAVPAAQSEDQPGAESAVPERPKMRLEKVELPESSGASIVADGRTEEVSGADLGYIIWCLRGLGLMNEEPTPDLSRWKSRCLRSCRLDAVPSADDADHARYVGTWNRITLGDRSAAGSVAYQVPSWKLNAAGDWVLADSELAMLRRNSKAKPPRHRPSAEQAAIWARWTAVTAADHVELHIR